MSAAGGLVHKTDDGNEDEASAGSRRIAESAFAESMAQLPANVVLGFSPSLKEWYLSNNKSDSRDSPRGRRNGSPIMQSRRWAS